MAATQEFIKLAEFCRRKKFTRARGSQLKKGGLPMVGDMVIMPEADLWYGETIHQGKEKRGPKESGSQRLPAAARLLEAQARKESALAGLRELELRKRKGELLEADEASETWTAIIAATRSHLLLLPAKLGHQVAAITDPGECGAIVDNAIKEALKSLSEYKLTDPKKRGKHAHRK